MLRSEPTLLARTSNITSKDCTANLSVEIVTTRLISFFMQRQVINKFILSSRMSTDSHELCLLACFVGCFVSPSQGRTLIALPDSSSHDFTHSSFAEFNLLLFLVTGKAISKPASTSEAQCAARWAYLSNAISSLQEVYFAEKSLWTCAHLSG